VTALKFEQQHEPLSNDEGINSISWKITSDLRNTLQTSYQIQVIASDGSFENPTWDSGIVPSGQSLFVPYCGPELAAGSVFSLRIRVRDNHNRESEWSVHSTWAKGFVAFESKKAEWITYDFEEDITKPSPVPMLRREFELPQAELTSARLYITSLGLYEAEINGVKVGRDHFTPGWTSFHNRVQYQVYDVTDQLKTGSNAIGVRLGDGWYRGWMTWERTRNLYGDRLALVAQLVIRTKAGDEIVVATDRHWSATTGSIRYSDIYDGERVDLRLEKQGWSEPGYDDHEWRDVRIFSPDPEPQMVALEAAPVRETQAIEPARIWKGSDGATLVDFGQNLVGWVRLQIQGTQGQEIVIRHGEVLDSEGGLYTENLRDAEQKVTYVLANTQTVVLEPKFTFHGFRFIEIRGIETSLNDAHIRAIVLHSDLKKTGEFTSSHAGINGLQHNIVWAQKGNFLDIPTDCPQRDERMGWTGDAQVFATTAMFNMDVSAFFTKWLKDLALDQSADGSVSSVVPDVYSLAVKQLPKLRERKFYKGVAAWGDAATIVPMALYEHYGNLQMLEMQYPSMRAWAKYVRRKAKDPGVPTASIEDWPEGSSRKEEAFIWNGSFTFGDWLAPVKANDVLTATAYYANTVSLLVVAAKLLGKTKDVEEFEPLIPKIRAAFASRFVDENGYLKEESQSAYVLALKFEMIPPEFEQQAAARLNKLIQEAGYHLQTGFLSTAHILDVLTEYGFIDTAYKLLLQESYPSWLYPISKGATTIWEHWGSILPDGTYGNSGMNSFNHYAYGSVGSWMYRTIAGLRSDAPAFRKVVIEPRPGGGLTFASGKLETPYGLLAANWKDTNDAFELEVEIAPNTSGRVVLHDVNDKPVLESGSPLSASSGILGSRHYPDKTLEIFLGSGKYRFVVPKNESPLP